MSERWKTCAHAKERMSEMGLTRRDVLETLLHPVLEYPGSVRYADGRRVAADGRLAVVYNPETRTVITVLWHAEEARQLGVTAPVTAPLSSGPPMPSCGPLPSGARRPG